MVIEPKQTTVAYRCPHCGAGVLSAVGMFALTADMMRLKCTCGKSALEIVYSKDGKVRLKVPCMICPNGHSYTVSKNIFFGRDIFVLPCPVSDINICFMGETERVKAELANTELELLQLLEDNGISSFEALQGDERMLSDPQIAEIVLFVIHDLEQENKIYCRCNPAPTAAEHREEASSEEERVYDVEILEDGIRVSCTECGCERVIPTDSLLTAHAFLNCDALYLE